MRLLKSVRAVAVMIAILGIFLSEIGFKDTGFKLFMGGSMAIGILVGLFLLFSIIRDYLWYDG